jgi:transposase-like protein
MPERIGYSEPLLCCRKEHWKHIRTANVVESPFAALRLRTDAAKRYKKVASAQL